MMPRPERIAVVVPPRDVELAVLNWLIASNNVGRPPRLMAKLLSYVAALDERRLPFDRVAVAEALSLNVYTQDTMMRLALARGHIREAYYVPCPALSAIVRDGRLTLEDAA